MRRNGFPLALLLLLPCAPLAAQNLFVNPDLDTDTGGWVLACGSSPTWQTDDESGCLASGSVHVTSGSCQGLQGSGMGQCFAAGALTSISTTGRVRAPSGYVLAVFEAFPTVDCSGAPTTTINSTPVVATGDWQSVSLDDVAVPGGSGSILVGFGAGDFTAVDADIDAGYAGERALVFRDGFEGDPDSAPPSCRWSTVTP
jgi:hypothetical protein